MRDPDVSFAIACYNCRAFLRETVHSALAQADVSVELLLVDDGSTDGTRELMATLAREDARIRTFATVRNGGPGAARNVALAQMRGRWFAVLDSDDLILPTRSRTLIAAAERHHADLVADDLVLFGEGIAEQRFFAGHWGAADWMTLDRYFADTVMFGAAPNAGFLKPMIRAEMLDRTGIRYDERLRIAEDDHLIIRLLMAGGRYWIEPEPLYRYRKHDVSISHRLSSDHVDRMALAGHDLDARVRAAGVSSRHYRRRRRALADVVAFTHAIDLLKARRPFAAVGEVVRRPTCVSLFRMPLAAAAKRLAQRG